MRTEVITMNYRKGDKVSIVGTVKYTSDGKEKIFIELPDYHTDIWVRPDVVTLVQADFEVGDKCTWPNLDEPIGENKHTGTVLAVSDGHAWIDRGSGDYCTRILTTIERVDSDD
jgi:hypothetical protein